ncbi:MAG: hypothetical protein OXF02_05795 [Simkaniaceae bacterium]|nr:hypothetical protein [Simkaniaceae bacterium]
MSILGVAKRLTDRLFGNFAEAFLSVCGEEDPPPESFPSDRFTEPRGDGPYLLESMRADKQGLLHRAGVRKDVVIVQCYREDVGCAVGINALRWGDAVIYLDGDICRIDRSCSEFFLNHEIKHILSGDHCTLRVVAGVNDLVRPTVSVVGCFKAMHAFSRRGVAGAVAPLLGVVATCLACNRIVGALFRWREAKADDFAIINATDEELKGGWRFFTACRRIERDEARILRELFARSLFHPFELWRERIMTSSSVGWYLCNPGRPSYESRLRKIRKALAVREIEIDGTVEERRVEGLRVRVVEQRMDGLYIRMEEQAKPNPPDLFSESCPAMMYRAYDSMVCSGSADTLEESESPGGS